jgi:hypothetical protein
MNKSTEQTDTTRVHPRTPSRPSRPRVQHQPPQPKGPSLPISRVKLQPYPTELSDELKRVIRDKLRQGNTLESVMAWLDQENERLGEPYFPLNLETWVQEIDEEIHPPGEVVSGPPPYRQVLDPEREFFQVGNCIFDWNLPLPPAHKLVLLCLHRFANNRKFPPRTVSKISQQRIGLACSLDRRTVSVAPRCLAEIGLITITPARTRSDGTRLTAEYYVPTLSKFDKAELMSRITKIRQSQPDLVMLRPDQAKRDRRAKRERGHRRVNA